MTPTLAQGLTPVRVELDSGAVVLVQSTSLTPAVTIHATFRAGSQFDPPDRSGLAYLTARLLDRGTERRNANGIAEELDDRGVSLKISATRHALTVSCTCLSEDFDAVFSIVADVCRRPTFPPVEIEKRRAETVTRLRQREDNPASRAVDSALELLYGADHPYGRPSKGTSAGIELVERAEMVAFHAARVRPAGLSLAVVGDLQASRCVDRVAAELDGWTGALLPDDHIPPAPARQGRQERWIDMPGKTQTDIAYGFTAIRRLDPRFYAYWMMNIILGQFGLGGRLADNIRERQGMAYYAFSTFDPGRGESPLLVRAGVDPANVGRTLTAIDHEVARLAAAGPTPRELDETRAYLIGSIPRLLETNESIASFLQTIEEFGLGLDFDARLPSLLQEVRIEDVHAAAQEVLDPGAAAVAVAGPSASAST